MATQELTPTQDKAIRHHLAIASRLINGTYQGEYLDTNKNITLGDRLQKAKSLSINGTRYLFIFNLLVTSKANGAVSYRVSAWHINENGNLVGSWPVRRTTVVNLHLTPSGWAKGTARGKASEVFAPYLAYLTSHALMTAVERIRNGSHGNRVKQIRTDRYGKNPYDTTTDHLLPYGGRESVMKLLMR